MGTDRSVFHKHRHIWLTDVGPGDQAKLLSMPSNEYTDTAFEIPPGVLAKIAGVSLKRPLEEATSSGERSEPVAQGNVEVIDIDGTAGELRSSKRQRLNVT